MGMNGYSAEKEALLKRLRRIEGQVAGISRMVDDDLGDARDLGQLLGDGRDAVLTGHSGDGVGALHVCAFQRGCVRT